MSFEQSVYTSSNEVDVVDFCVLIPNDYEYERSVSFSLVSDLSAGNTGMQ